jgi:hypothetical protein
LARELNVKHLAVHAITQIDVLAEIVAHWTVPAGCPKLDRRDVSMFRDKLGAREPALAVVRDAHDSHKHGELDRKTATHALQGQRPETVTKFVGFFLDHSFLDSPPTSCDVLVFILNDRTEKHINIMLDEAMKAWDRELAQLGL